MILALSFNMCLMPLTDIENAAFVNLWLLGLVYSFLPVNPSPTWKSWLLFPHTLSH